MANNELIRKELEGLPPWLAAMRAAVMKGVTEKDVEQIVQKQVERAKQGDSKALQFVFDHVLGGKQMQGATFIQNNYHGGEDGPTNAKPGTVSKIDAMRRRAAAGMPLHQNGDGGIPNLD